MGAAAGQPDPWLDAVHDFRRPMAALVLLAFLAGFADAAALLLWDVFVANQSGNVVKTGMGIAGADTHWPASLASILAFGAGGAASAAVGRRSGPLVPPAVRLLLAGGALLAWLLAVLLLPPDPDAPVDPSVLIVAFAMGVLATTLVRLGGVQVTTTYATGAVLRVGQASVEAVAPASEERGRARRVLAVTGGMLAAYAGGGAAGTVATRLLDRPLLPVGGLLLVVAVAVLLRRVRARGPVGGAGSG